MQFYKYYEGFEKNVLIKVELSFFGSMNYCLGF